MHRFVPDPSAPPAPALAPDQLAAIKRLVREHLDLPADTTVLVSDTACADPGCPVLQTTIAVFPPGRPTLRWRLARPRAALTALMLRQTLVTPPETVPTTPGLDAPVTLAT